MPDQATLERLRRRATRLHKQLLSNDPATAETAALRCRALDKYAHATAAQILAERDSFKHTQALHVIAIEAGYPHWDALEKACAQPEPVEIDQSMVFSGVIPWNAPGYNRAMSTLARATHPGQSAREYHRALVDAVVEASGAFAPTIISSHAERVQNINFWMHAHEDTLRVAGFISGTNGELVSQALVETLCASPYTVRAWKGPGHEWRTFDIHEIASTAILRDRGWSEAIPWRAEQRQVSGANTATPLLPYGARLGATTWYYAFPSPDRAIRLPQARFEAILLKREGTIDPDWTGPDGSLTLAGIVVLLSERTPRFVERVRLLRIPPRVDPRRSIQIQLTAPSYLNHLTGHTPARHETPPEISWEILAAAILQRSDSFDSDQARLAFTLRGMEGGNLPVQLSAQLRNYTTKEALGVYASGAYDPEQRDSHWWDLQFGRVVPPGLPIIAPHGSDEPIPTPRGTGVTHTPVPARTAVMPDPEPVSAVRDLNQIIERHRNALLRAVAGTNGLTQALCRCGKPECHNATPAHFSISRILGTLVEAWVTAAPGAGPPPGVPAAVSMTLAAALTDLDRDFNLWDAVRCNCDDPHCPARDPGTTTATARLSFAERAWRSIGGCRHTATYRADPDQAERNRDLLAAASMRLLSLSPEEARRVASIRQQVEELTAFRDTSERLDHCLRDHWGENWTDEMWNGIYATGIFGASISCRLPSELEEPFQFGLQSAGYAIACHKIARADVLLPFLAPVAGILDIDALEQTVAESPEAYRRMRLAVGQPRKTEGPIPPE